MIVSHPIGESVLDRPVCTAAKVITTSDDVFDRMFAHAGSTFATRQAAPRRTRGVDTYAYSIPSGLIGYPPHFMIIASLIENHEIKFTKQFGCVDILPISLAMGIHEKDAGVYRHRGH